MKHAVQSSRTGRLSIVDVPMPQIDAGEVLVSTRASVVSVGTDRMGVDFARKSLVGKAMDRPAQVKQVVQSAARDGIARTVERVRDKLDTPVALGYSSAGVVQGVGARCGEFAVGDRVACAGAGYAVHAEYVAVPRNLVVRVPDDVSFEAAAFTTLGAIALQGVRQADVRVGEAVAVIGLGLLGQLTVQILRASGVRAFAIDLDAGRVALATAAGATAALRSDDVAGIVAQGTDGIGADAVIITAATSSEDPIRLAGELARDRARVVIVGAVPMNVPRSPYFEKELDVRLSRSYGPGRYDPSYEEGGNDYPIGYVRWTERRNMQEFLRLLSIGAIDVAPLVTHRYPFVEAEAAYAEIMAEDASPAPLGVVFAYPEPEAEPSRIPVRPASRVDGDIGVALIGAGSFARDVLVPALEKLPVQRVAVVTGRGLTARRVAERHGFAYIAGSAAEVRADDTVHAIIIATPHADHAEQTAAALAAGKAVFVEKPLALDAASLERVIDAARGGRQLMVGFNRRFAPATAAVVERLARTPGARQVHIRVNAGRIPAHHWIHDPDIGGGRLLGEGCHFIDLACHLACAPPVTVSTVAIGGEDPDARLQDNFAISLTFANGSIATITYTAKGDAGAGKERIEVFAGGQTFIIDDFRSAEIWAGGKREVVKLSGQDKGHRAEVAAFIDAVRSGAPSPIPLEELYASSRATLCALQALHTGRVVRIDDDEQRTDTSADASTDAH